MRSGFAQAGGDWRTFGSIIERNAQNYPQVTAVVDGARRITYSDYLIRCRRLADALHGLGVRHGDRVGMLAVNGAEYCEFYGACEVAGYVAAPLNSRLGARELAPQLALLQPKALIFDQRLGSVVANLATTGAYSGHVIVVGAEVGDCKHLLYDSVLNAGEDRDPPRRPRPDDIAYLMSTSGTTGTARAVIRTHRACTVVAEQIASDWRTPQGGSSLVTTPLSHVGGKEVRGSQLWRGGTTVALKGFEPRAVLETIQRERIAATFLVSTQLQALLAVSDFDSFDLSSLATVCIAGAPCPVPLLTRAMQRMGPIFCVQYGMTENMIATLHRGEFAPDGTPAQIERIRSVGHSIPQGEIAVVDDSGARLGMRERGEVCTRSETMFEGYWGDEAGSREAMRGGWFRTGDVGYLDEEGYLFLVDRVKDVIVSGGENVYSREVEDALRTHSAVLDAAVIGAPHPHWGETVRACVIRAAGREVEARALIDHCRQLIARYKCPTSVVFVEEFPLTANGKISKVQLREHYGGSQL